MITFRRIWIWWSSMWSRCSQDSIAPSQWAPVIKSNQWHFFFPFFLSLSKSLPQNGEAGPAFEASMSWHWFNWFRYDVSFLHFSKNSQVLCSGISYFPPADAVFRVTDLELFRKAGTALDLCEFVLTIGYWKGFPMLHPTAIGNTSRAKALLRAKIIHQFLIEFLQCPSDLSFLERE